MIDYRGRNRRTVNYIKTITFDYPEWIPHVISISPSSWMKYREQLEDLVLRHPRVFPEYRKGEKDFDEISERLISTAFSGFSQEEREEMVKALVKMLNNFG